MKKTLILGIGNTLLSDDGIGSRLTEDLTELLDPELFDFTTTLICSMETLHLIRDYEKLIILDGQRTRNGKPGEISIYNSQTYSGTLHLDNFHDVAFRDLIFLGKKLEMNLPEEIHIIAFEIKEDQIFNNELSPTLQKLYPEILTKTRKTIAIEMQIPYLYK